MPEPLGVDGDIERLSFLAGDAGGDGWRHQHTDRGLASAARLLRRIHDAGRDWVPPEDAVWVHRPSRVTTSSCATGTPGRGTWCGAIRRRSGRSTGTTCTRPRGWTTWAYALQWFAPPRSDELALEWHHFPAVPDRRHRVRVFLDAYGPLPRFDVVDVVTARMQATDDLVRHLAQQGQEPQRTWVEDGELQRGAEEIAWVRAHRHLVE